MNLSNLSRRETLIVTLLLVAVLVAFWVAKRTLGDHTQEPRSGSPVCAQGCPCGSACISCSKVCRK